jgi:autotransporter-associated beta strand protein
LALVLLSTCTLRAQTPRDFAIDLGASVSNNTPYITLSWTQRQQANITAQKIHRRFKGQTTFVKLSDLTTNQTTYADNTAVPGVEYEYWMERTYTSIYPTTAMGYLSAGVNVPMAESRGKLLLVIDSTMVTPLAPEIAQLQADLTGDGWTVQTITALRTDTAINTKALIKAAYDADPTNLKMVYILGHVPVPYSGSIAPDGHGNHSGAWPADGYYGDMNGTWTDTSVNNITASDVRNRNIPGDGKFDQSNLPSPVELMVGRVDLHSMTRAPASSVSETSLLRRYLRKAHDFKFKQGAYANIPRRSMLRNGFGYFGGENFAIAGWSWIFTGVGRSVDEPPTDQWFSPSYAGGKSYLVGYGDGGGSWDTAGGVGNSADFGLKTSRVVFTSLFGSYFGDWDVANNFMRAPLAGNATGDSLGLTCFWGGRPNRVTHQMGMGETAGYCMMVSHNSAQTGGAGYTPNIYAGVHCGLVGDPALRLHAVEPPRNLSASSANTQVALAWTPSIETNLLGYLVYRADTAAGPFTRLTVTPQAATTYTDATVIASQSYTYIVRTLKLETSPGGTYENPSVGSLITLTVNAGATAAPLNPTALSVTQNSSTNASLAWVDNASTETGFRIERKTNAGGAYASVGTVGASVTNFTDTGVFTQGNVYYYRVIALGATGESLPSSEASFEAFAGFFDLPATRMKVSKTAGTVLITVNRFGGVTGAVTVNYATANSSATAGTHYAATNGTLFWADGELGAKTLAVSIINTATPQAARQLKVTLSSPSAGSAVSINSSIAVLIEDPTATLAAPWSQTILNGSITDSSAATLVNGEFGSVTIGGAGVSATATYEAGRFIYQSRTGDGVMTAFFPAGIPSDWNAREALMVRASTANNAIMAAAATSANTSFGSLLSTRTAVNSGTTVLPATANNLVLARWMRLSRAGNVFTAETSADGSAWTLLGAATLASMPSTALWGIFHFSSDWNVTGLGNYHLALVQSLALTDLPPPNAPTGAVAVATSPVSVALTWNSVANAIGYRIERCSETNAFVQIADVTPAASTFQTFVDSGLTADTAYAYRVTAYNAIGTSAPSPVAYAATPPPDISAILTTDDAGGADATVRLDLPDVPLGTQTNLTLAGHDSKTYSVLTNAAKSYLRFNLAGVGAFANAKLKIVSLGLTNSVTPGRLYLYTTLLDESSDTWDESTITWTNAPQNSLEDYDFIGDTYWLGYQYGGAAPAAGQSTTIDLDIDTLNSYRGANDLITIGLYQYYDVTEWASREHPDYAPPTLELSSASTLPSRASFLTAVPGNGWSIALAWKDNSVDETGFVIERREGAGEFAVFQTLGSNTVSFWDTTTQPGVTYTYRVRSFSTGGNSSWTPEVTLTAATLETAISTLWDGGGADTLFTTLTNWDFNTLPVSDGSMTVTFGTAGSTATVNTNLSLRGIVLNRDADFTFADGGGLLTLGAGGLSALLPTTTSRTYALAATMALATNQTWNISTNVAGTAAVTVSGGISGNGPGSGFMKSGYGVLTLTASNSYEGVTTVSNGLLAISHANALGRTNGNTVVRCASGGYLHLSGGINVAEPLTLNGERPNYAYSMFNSSGSNTWSGPITRIGQTRINANGGTTLAITGGMTGGGGLCVVNSGGTIAFYGTPLNIGTDTLYMDSGGLTVVGVAGNTWGDTQVAGGTLRMEVANGLPAATILKIGLSYSTGGTFDLNGFNQTVGQLRNETALAGTRVVTSATPAVLTVNQDVNSGYDGRLTGALGLTKSGSGSLTLSGTPNTQSGTILVQGGTLTVTSLSSLGNSTNIAVAGGTLELQTQTALTNTATLSIADGAKVSVAAGLSETVQALYLGGVRKGRGTWGASGSGAEYVDDAHFSGSGTVYVASGESTFWDGGGADTSIGTGGNWDLDASPAFDGTASLTFGTGGAAAAIDRPVSLTGLVVNRDADFTFAAGGGTLTLGTGGLWARVPAATPRAYTLASPVALATDQVWCVTNNGAAATTLIVSGAVSDGASAFGIAKSGNGLCTLAGNSSYDGATTVASGGALRVTHSNGLGSTNGATAVASTGWLEVGGNVTVPEPLTFGNASLSGALLSTDGTNVWSGRITQTASSRVCVNAGSRLTLSGGVSGAYDLLLAPAAGAVLEVGGAGIANGSSRKVAADGGGSVLLGGSGHTFGTLEVGGGTTVKVAGSNAVSAALILSLGPAYGTQGTFDLNGYNVTVSQLKRSVTAVGNRAVTSAAPATLTVSGSTSTAYDGSLSGALSLVKSGGSTLTLYGTSNTFTGSTTVSGGTLQVEASVTLGNSTNITVNGGTLRLRNASSIQDAATLRIEGTGKVNIDSGLIETVSTLILDAGRKSKGTWGATGSGADHIDDNHFTGTGVIYVPTSNSTQWDGGGTNTNASVPENWDYDELPLLDGTVYLTFGLGGETATVNTNLSLLGLHLNRDVDFTLANGGSTLTLGAGGLWAQAPSTNARAYTLAANTLLATNQNWGVTNNGAVSTRLTVSGSVSDGASAFGITKSGNGLLTLSGDSSFDGPVSVATGGVLRVAHNNALGSTIGATVVASNAWLEVGGNVSVPEPLTVGDATTAGALRSTDGTNAWAGRITQTASSRICVWAGSRLTLSGGVSGTYDFLLAPAAGAVLEVGGAGIGNGSSRKVATDGGGSVLLGGTGHTFGTLEVGGGTTVKVTSPSAVSAALVLSLGPAYGTQGTFDLNGYNVTVNQLKRTVTAVGNRVVTSAAPATLTVSGTTSTSYDGSLSGALSLVKSGGSTLTLYGTNNTYSGTTTVSGGTLQVEASVTLGNSTVIRVTGGTLRLRNAASIPDTSSLTIADGGAMVRIDSGEETVGMLRLGTTRQRRGTYGASTSNAQYKNDAYFSTSGAGVIRVLRGPESVISVR